MNFPPQQMDIPSLAFPTDRRVLSVYEVADKLGVTHQHALDLVSEGRLAAVDVGCAGHRFWRVPVEAYTAFLDARLSAFSAGSTARFPALPMVFPSLLFPRDRQILNIHELEGKLAVTRQHMLNLIDEGQMTAVNVGGSGKRFWRIPVEAYVAFLKARHSANIADK